jgi:hypothetical protein
MDNITAKVLGSITTPVFKNDRGLMLDDTIPVMFRDAVMESIYVEIARVKRGACRRVLLTGNHGTGKSFILKKVHSAMNGKLKTALIHVDPGMKRSDFYELINQQVLTGASLPAIRAVKSAFLSSCNAGPVLFLIDDLDAAEYRLGRDIMSIMSSVPGISVIATSTDPRVLMIPFDVKVSIEPFSQYQITSILERVMKENINECYMKDFLVAGVCARHVIKHFKSSMTVAIDAIASAFISLEKQCLFHDREQRYVKIDDIEAAFERHDEMKSPRDDHLDLSSVNNLVVMAVLSLEGNDTIDHLLPRVQVVIRKLFPDSRIPSVNVLRSVLRDLKSAGVIYQEKGSDGFSSGVKTRWIYNTASKHDPRDVASIAFFKSMKRILSSME